MNDEKALFMKKLRSPVGFILFLFPLIQGASFGFFHDKVVRIILAAMWEEILFRFVLLKLLQRQFSFRSSSLISAVIFGLFHGLNILNGMPPSIAVIQILYAMCAGYGFAALYRECGHIWPGILIHALINLTAPADLSYRNVWPTILFGIGFILYGLFIFRTEQSDRSAQTRK